MTAAPPVNNIAVTRMLVMMPKTVKTLNQVRFDANILNLNLTGPYKCVVVPNLALITSRKVWALGARLLSSMAILANNRIWTVAPEAYQNGPDTPYLYETAELCKRVAAHVQEETTAEATRPDLTVLPAVLNISEVCSSLL